MSSYQKIIVIGNLGKDPDLRFTPSGVGACRFSVATTEKWQDGNGSKQEHTEWHNVVVWGKHAEVCSQYLHKGAKVMVEGAIRSRKYEKDGVERTIHEIKSDKVVFLETKNTRSNGAPAPRADAAKASEDDDDGWS